MFFMMHRIVLLKEHGSQDTSGTPETCITMYCKWYIRTRVRGMWYSPSVRHVNYIRDLDMRKYFLTINTPLYGCLGFCPETAPSWCHKDLKLSSNTFFLQPTSTTCAPYLAPRIPSKVCRAHSSQLGTTFWSILDLDAGKLFCTQKKAKSTADWHLRVWNRNIT